MKKNLVTAIIYTAVTTLLLGLGYPLLITALAQLVFHDKANGSLIVRDGKVTGSKLIAQPFTGPQYFHPRPSAAGTNGYDATASGATNFGPTNQKLVDRVHADVTTLQAENPGKAVPIDAVTTSASGLDPDITIANAEFQAVRVAKVRGLSEQQVMADLNKSLEQRQFGVLGEPRVNVLLLNAALDEHYPAGQRKSSTGR